MKHAALALAIIALFTALTSYAEERSNEAEQGAAYKSEQQKSAQQRRDGVDMTVPDDEPVLDDEAGLEDDVVGGESEDSEMEGDDLGEEGDASMPRES